MAFLLKAGKHLIRKCSKSQFLSAKSPAQSTSASTLEKTYEDLFAWVAADVHAHSRYTCLLSRLCVPGPEMEPSKTENSAEISQSTRSCVLRVLENLSRKDQMNMLLCFLANNPEVLKVLFVGSMSSTETISKTKLQITFPKMINTIAKELNNEWLYEFSRFRFESEGGFFHCVVNVSDMEKDSPVVFIQDNLLILNGKLRSKSIYEETMRDVVDENVLRRLYEAFELKQEPGGYITASRVPYEGYDLNQATGEIIEEGELRISYPAVVEEVEKPSALHVKLKLIDD